MTLRSMVDDDHECEYNSKDTDCDLCRRCGEHAEFCETCGLSDCCGYPMHVVD